MYSPDPRNPTSLPVTIAEIVEKYDRDLKPDVAIQNWDNGNWRIYVVSPIFSQVLYDGQVIDLQNKQGRHAAIYVRVSTSAQGEQYSITQQIESGIIAAIKSGFAFRIYSDKGFSGFYAINAPEVIQKIRDKQAKYYREAYEEAILRNAETWNTPAQIATMREFLDHRCKALKLGEKEALAEWKEKQPDRDWNNVNLVFSLRYQHHNGVRFRPDLHAFVDDIESIHTVYITDADRLSRNQMLFVVLGELFKTNNVTVVSSERSADWLVGEELHHRLHGMLIGFEAEGRIKKGKVQVLRGLVRHLREGRPHSHLPFWLQREQKYACFRTKAVPLIQEVVRLAETKDEYYGEAKIASALHGKWEAPRYANVGQRVKRLKANEHAIEEPVIHSDTVGHWLRNPLLYGCQVMLGREWPLRSIDEPVWPRPDNVENPLALISRERFWAMQERRQRENPNHRGQITANPKLGNKIIRCWCGYIVRFKAGYVKPTEKRDVSPDRYRCTCPPNERKVHLGYHALFAADELDNFVLDLCGRAAYLFTRSSEQEDSLEQQELELRNHLNAERTRYRQEGAAHLKDVPFPPDSPTYQSLLSVLVKGQMEQLQSEYDEAIKRVERARKRQQSVAALRERVDFNIDIRSLSKENQMKRIQGLIAAVQVAPDLSQMFPYNHNGDPLPPIPLKPERTTTSEVRVCHLPSLAEYVASVEIPEEPSED